MRLYLESVDPWKPRLRWELLQFPAMLGTSIQATFRMQDRGVAPEHCKISCVNGVLQITSLQRGEPVLVNETPIKRNRILTSGDTITIGIRTLELVAMPSLRIGQAENQPVSAEEASVAI